ncbi:response regulator [Azonexus sp. IMCC34839]|uniref:response regulator n=1 Tax=Azonexus sp. IMCC34839 TaxID=3133695 RepID=UPI00399A54CA
MPTDLNLSETGLTALVVEDNSLFRVVLSSMLIQRGFSVIEEKSAEQALNHLRTTPIDLVLLDIMMPGMSGIELCHQIREELELEDIPVIAYTAHSDMFNVAHMRMAGFNDILTKPISAEALERALQQYSLFEPSHANS